MDGFAKMIKMKVGGSVSKAVSKMCGGGKSYKSGGDVDEKQDKALIKKAFKQHDEAEHDKEPTEIKLKNGGRSAKKEGTVRKFKTGGSVTNVYEAKKGSGDLDNIQKTKDIKPGKADAPNAATKRPTFAGSDVDKENSKPAGNKDAIKKVPPTGDKKADASSGVKEMPNKYKTGGNVKKMQAGSLTGRLSDYVMGTNAQNAKAKEDMARYLRAKQLQEQAGKEMGAGEKMAMGLAGLGQGAPAPAPAPASGPTQMPPTDQMGAPTNMPMQKRGGRAGKK